MNRGGWRKRWARLAGLAAGLLGGAGWVPAARADESVVNSKHDLSARSPHRIRAVDETEICIFCHAPHNAAPQTPLWNRENPQVYYRIYESSTTDARIDQPGPQSKMCLSCHDGSLALGNILSRPVEQPLVMTARTMPPGQYYENADLTNDLSDDHPIGFRYDRALSNIDPQIRSPELVSRELSLGPHREVECATCHDPHNNQLGDFLRITDQMSAICVTCHDLAGWECGSHATSRGRTTGREVDLRERLKYSTVADNACANCHRIHSAPQRERLLRYAREEDNCLNCHSGSVARFNIAAEIGKRSNHDVRRYGGVHDAAESHFRMRRHAECVDCHNPHAAAADHLGIVQGTFGPTAQGPLLNVAGVTLSGRETTSSRLVYEICFKCHADSALRPRLDAARQVQQTNVRLQLQTSNPSFHPVIGPRRNPDMASLIAPLRSGSLITCTDCHNSDNSRFAGGTGANGPHGSIYEPLLVANYTTDDFAVENATAYALCYRCHDRDSILNDESFPLHRRHIVDARAPCSVCHDAHGVYRGQANAVNHSNLINFDLRVVSSSNTPDGRRLEYIDTGRRSGTCALTCHGVPHVPFTYANDRGGGTTARARAADRGGKP